MIKSTKCAGIFFWISLFCMCLVWLWTGPRIFNISAGPEATSPEAKDPSHQYAQKTSRDVVSDQKKKKKKKAVLVTGAAGFIGYHLSLSLHGRADVEVVVGVDLFVEMYDPRLKRDRAGELLKSGVRFFRGDVCDHAFLQFLFGSYRFTHVVHLAACAGVRRSMDDPRLYLHHNVDCFLSLLHTIKDHQVSVIYASSSSTYGQNSSLPFSPASALPPFSPASIYATTKLSNEMFASAFCEQHELRIIGLRFFTVYGPWGRPDMAIYKFAESILSGDDVIMFESSKPLGRDFTYVTDVVSGIVSALDYVPSRCGEVFNLGRGQTVGVEQVLQLLEVALNKTAKIVHRPLPLSDVPLTLSDISLSRQALDYSPSVSIQQGVGGFTEWLIWYKKNRKEDDDKDSRLEKMLVNGEKQVERVRRNKLREHNTQYRDRLGMLRNKYAEFAKLMSIATPSELKKAKFIRYPGVTSRGFTIAKLESSGTGIEQLIKQCRVTEQCVAFTSTGEFKSHLQPRHKWGVANISQDLYAAAIDVCEVDLHNCGKNEECVYTGPSTHNCTCKDGYIRWRGACLERYVRGVAGRMEEELILSDYFEGRNWQEMTAGKEFVFFEARDSPEGDYLVVEGVNVSVETLKEACLSTHHCLGFNSKGILKHSLRPPHEWRYWSRQSTSGLYVLDIDYCSMQSESCPPFSQCERLSRGLYDCECHAPLQMSEDHRECVSPDSTAHVPDNCVHQDPHVILSLDQYALPGLLPLINSLVQHRAHSIRPLHLHVVLSGLTRAHMSEYLSCYPPLPSSVSMEMVQMDPAQLDRLIKVYSPVQLTGNLSSVANFARFFFHRLFPTLKKTLYLDMDTIVQADIQDLWHQLCLSHRLLLAAPRTVKYNQIFSPNIRDIYKKRYNKAIDLEEKTFNAGVYGVNLDMWRNMNIHTEVLYWLDQQYHAPLWKYGTQAVLLLVAYRQWSNMDSLWNVNGLGWQRNMDTQLLEKAKLIHWSGKGKPWLAYGLHTTLWQPHVPTACSGHGKCEEKNRGGYTCKCFHGYQGVLCESE